MQSNMAVKNGIMLLCYGMYLTSILLVSSCWVLLLDFLSALWYLPTKPPTDLMISPMWTPLVLVLFPLWASHQIPYCFPIGLSVSPKWLAGWPLGASLPACDVSLTWLQAVLCLSPEQIRDLMFLRRIFFLRRQELAVQRAKLTQQMQDETASTLAHATRVKDVAGDLQQNAAADHQNFHRFAWATYFGVGPRLHWQSLLLLPNSQRLHVLTHPEISMYVMPRFQICFVSVTFVVDDTGHAAAIAIMN